jgi:L-ribulose-5-phosphate 4-epimerase
MSGWKDLRNACREAHRALAATGLVELTFGNLSLLDEAGSVFAIKPSGIAYDALTPDDIVVVDLEGHVVEGFRRPSSDEPTHRLLLATFAAEGVRSVVHTHSRAAVAFAQAALPLPPLGTTHADHFHGAVPVTRELGEGEVGEMYEWETGRAILDAVKGKGALTVPAALVRHHGPFVWGATAGEAIENALALEICADMALRTLALAPSIAPIPAHLAARHHARKHGPGATYGQR